MSSLPVNAPTLTSLHLQGCRDFEETELFDGLLYGKKVGHLIFLVLHVFLWIYDQEIPIWFTFID
jgi:hypothetical protein